MNPSVTYREGAELPDLTLEWLDSNGDVINYSSGWSFSVTVTPAGSATASFTTTSVTGASTSPNVTVAWTSSNLGALTAGRYVIDVTATRSSDSKDRKFPPIALVVTP